MQTGGSDQWGNITAGIDLIRRVQSVQAFGATFPLLTTSSGTKFGKTEAGAVWLDPNRTSPFRFYQFWINSADTDAVRYLKTFTLLSGIEISRGCDARAAAPAPAAQRAGGRRPRRVHGEDGLARARRATESLFGGELEGLSADDIADVFADVPSSDVPRSALSGGGVPITDLLTLAAIAPSRGEAKRALQGGGVYLNNRRVEDSERRVTLEDAIDGRFLVLRKGKKSYHLIRVIG